MATLKFWNVGKANAEIERLEAELAAAKAAKPSEDPRIAELLASNESAASKLTETLAALDAAKQEAKDLSAAAAGVNAQIDGAFTALNLPTAAVATPAEKLSAIVTASKTAAESLRKHLATIPGCAHFADKGTLAELIAAEQNATNTAMASLSVKTATLPATPPQADKPMNETERCLAAVAAAKAGSKI